MNNERTDPNDAVLPGMAAQVAFGWILALVPLSWGVWQTAIKVAALFP